MFRVFSALELVRIVGAQTPTPSETVAVAEKTAHMLERTGLYGIIVILLFSVGLLFWMYVRLNREMFQLIVGMTEKQTTVLQAATETARKVEQLLDRVNKRLDDRGA